MNIIGLSEYIVMLWLYDDRYKFTDAGGQTPDFGYAQYTAAALSQFIINGQRKSEFSRRVNFNYNYFFVFKGFR